jgi:hypothetical protein
LLNRIIWKFRWNTVVTKNQHTSILPTHIYHAIVYEQYHLGCQSVASFTSALSHRQATF